MVQFTCNCKRRHEHLLELLADVPILMIFNPCEADAPLKFFFAVAGLGIDQRICVGFLRCSVGWPTTLSTNQYPIFIIRWNESNIFRDRVAFLMTLREEPSDDIFVKDFFL